jgi:hypothetical protein
VQLSAKVTHEILSLPPPSMKTPLGVTSAKKRIKKDLAIKALLKPVRCWPNQKRKFKREIGYESASGRLLRDGRPKPGGCLVAFVDSMTLVGKATLVAWIV